MGTATGRFVVAYEGKKALPHQVFIEPGSISMEDDRIPVTWNFNASRLVGWATDFQRDVESGEISVEIVFDDPDVLYFIEHDSSFGEMFSASMCLSNMEMTGKQFKGGNMTYGRLRSVALVPTEFKGTWE